jgi:hypothetical protein
MMILPVLLFLRSIRRAGLSLCFFRRSIPGTRKSLDGSAERRIRLTNAKIGPVVFLHAVLSLLHHTEDLGLDRVRRLLVLLTFALQIMLCGREEGGRLSVPWCCTVAFCPRVGCWRWSGCCGGCWCTP